MCAAQYLEQTSMPKEWAEHAEAVREADTENFAELLRKSGLNPQKHLRFADWSGVSFENSDLRGFDFTGARLVNCNFKGALIDGARFDQAEINGANLREAKDWRTHVSNWRKPERRDNADRSLPLFSAFQDAPFGPEMVVIPPGSFMMGSPEDEPERSNDEGPLHEVTIARAFAVGRYPVTVEEYAHFCKVTKRKAPNFAEGKERHPVVEVSWNDAKAYAEWLSSVTGAQYRLLTEAEWEFACRAGTQTRYSFGDVFSVDQANNGSSRTEVGSYPVNGFGLFDMHGNVDEWVEDVWHEVYEGAPTDGGAWLKGGDANLHVVRGGSWNYFNPRFLRSAYRSRDNTGNRNFRLGFRIARTLTS